MNKEDVMNKKRYTVKWIALLMQAVCLFFVFSGAAYAAKSCRAQCRADPGLNTHPALMQACIIGCHDPSSCVSQIAKKPKNKKTLLSCLSVDMTHGQHIVRYMLIPLQFLITYIAYIMAFFFLAWGLYRLRHAHEGGGANRQASGVGSALCFFAAALLFQYQYAVKLVGNSFLGIPSKPSGSWNYSSGTQLPMDPPNLFGYFNLAACKQKNNKDRDSCSKLAGSDSLEENNKTGILTSGGSTRYNWSGNKEEYATLETLFATLMIIGFISFVRGAMLIVKAGEGTMQAGESTGTKAVTHILAGGLLCNANHVASAINNMVNQVNN